MMLIDWRVGEVRWGGYAAHACVKATGWSNLLRWPPAARPWRSAGLTPDKGEVLVTGAVGGVGSVAVAILPGTASSPTCRWKSSKR
jgi:acrylyl-CoA reductase (NADPH)